MNQHYIARVKDSINDYREVQSTYFDGAAEQAEAHFRTVLGLFFGNHRYLITMQANPIVLQEAQ